MDSEEQLSIFLVDDDSIFLKTLEHRIGQQFTNANISKFLSGEECLEHLHYHPQIIVLDYFLNSNSPDAMDGIRVLEQIKLHTPETNVIILSSQDKMGVAMNAIKLGAVDYVIKNKNTFLRLQNAMKNAVKRITLANQLKTDRARMKLFIALALTAVAIVILFQLYYPKIH